MTARIDAHQHFWHPSRGDYSWMPVDDPVLSRPYLPADLDDALASTGVTRTVLVQAAPSIAETDYMLGLADATPSIARVVGWIPFEDPAHRATLDRFARHPKFAGVRPMIQDIDDDDWMLRPDLDWAFQAIVELDLTFDCLGFPRHLANFHELLTRYPRMRAVIDHCMKPQIASRQSAGFQAWSDGMRLLADDTSAFCKLSGLVTEAGEDWSPGQLKPFVDVVLDAFGPQRVMWGSDWPVCRLRCEYGDWFAGAQSLCGDLNLGEQARIFGETAREFYRVGD